MISQELGISIGTVSIVLNGRGDEKRISKATQQRILECAKRFHYQPNVFAKRLRHADKSGPIIALFWPSDFRMAMVGRFLQGIQAYQDDSLQNAELILQPYDQNNFQQSAAYLSSGYYSGAVIMGLSEKSFEYISSQEFDIPIVLMNRQSSQYSAVLVDDFDAGAMAASLLISRGHKKIALIGYGSHSRSSKMRRAGFINTCIEKGIILKQEYMIETDISAKGGSGAVETLLGQCGDDLPTGIFVLDSTIAFGALHAFHKHNIHIPEDLELVSYGDNPQDEYTIPSLTSIRMPLEQMSQDCMRIMSDLLSNKLTNNVSYMHSASVVCRDSCGMYGENYFRK